MAHPRPVVPRTVQPAHSAGGVEQRRAAVAPVGPTRVSQVAAVVGRRRRRGARDRAPLAARRRCRDDDALRKEWPS